MGAAKFPEEIVERQIEDSNAAELLRTAVATIPAAPKPVLKYCPLCYEGYIEDEMLDNHIALRHGKHHVYLRLNNQVVRDVCWLRGPLRECTLVVLKVPQVKISITANRHAKSVSATGTTDLLKLLPAVSRDCTIEIEISSGPLTRNFTIYHGKQPSFRSERIDHAVEVLMKRIVREECIDLTAFRDDCLKLKPNVLEIRYLNGIIEYCHGLKLEQERKRDLARSRLESSMDLLIPFGTAIAEELRHALALRMNCFSGQWGCSDRSRFRIAERFFCTSVVSEELPEKDHQVNRLEISIDPVSRMVLDALEAYYDGDDQAVFKSLASIEMRDRNDEDKVTLIDARTRARKGELSGARAAYERFLEHPIFGEEADGYLRAVGSI